MSTAAGGVGRQVYVRRLIHSAHALFSVVVQIVKQQGLKVIGSAGSDEKVRYLKEQLGIDAAFNYKTEDLEESLKREGPIDIFWDHIGGKTLETVIDHLNPLGRVIASSLFPEY